MVHFAAQISSRIAAVLRRRFGDQGTAADPAVRRAKDERHGDYQSNCAMVLAKRLGKKPAEVASEIIAELEVEDLCEPPIAAGAGFINFQLRPRALSAFLESIPAAEAPREDRLGIEPTHSPQAVVVDFSSPNLAKEMHVGHLRSTVIGDCVARILEFQGHTVHRLNHVGDWGTQFGMLLTHLRRTNPAALTRPGELEIQDLESFYVQAKEAFDREPSFAEEARKTVVELQSGDPETLQAWRGFCDESLRHCHRIYDRLGVRLIDRGESFYNTMLPEVVAELREKNMVTESQGALCVFLEGFKSRDGEPLPIIIQKSDGGYNYAATDLAAIRHRTRDLRAKHLVYVVGATQKLHFDQLFAAARRAGWVDAGVRLDHLAFGSVLGRDGRPFKTREGGTVKLKVLLDEAVERAGRVLDEQPEGDGRKERAFSGQERERIAETIGLAAVKYFDLAHNPTSDYLFDLERMCSLDGNTAPYMLYAYARIQSIGRKAGIDFARLPHPMPIVLEHESELRLAKALCRFPEVIEELTEALRPNILTDYLYELSKAFNLFYDRKYGVRVIDAAPERTLYSRLRLCDLTARTLKLGLHLLGIEVLEAM